MQKTVLLDNPIHADALDRLRAEVTVLTPFGASPGEIVSLLPQVHGIVIGGLHMGPIEFDLARNLEVAGRHGVGMDNLDIPAATERGIPVTYTPDGPTESTAEHALMLILAVARRLSQLDSAVRNGNFSVRLQQSAMGRELEGKALGVIGFGRIGQRLAAMCRDALHMRIFVFDPLLDSQFVKDWGAIPVSELIELAGQVDILSLHVPLTPNTRRLVNCDIFQAMKPGAFVINTSRGPVVDESALIEALLDGHLAGAGLDVYDPQPPAADSPLLQFEQVVLTPHVASFTHEGRFRMGMTVVEDVLRALRGERPHYLANPDVWPSRRALRH